MKPLKRALVALTIWAGLRVPAAAAAQTETVPTRIATLRGAEIEVLLERPVGAGPFPTVVLGSGSGYTMQMPILERVARVLVANGVAVYRFNWAYHVSDREQGKQSADRSAEIEDMTTVVKLARAAKWSDSKRIFVGGKSLGSIIAWHVLRRDPNIAGALLLTPVCSRPNDPEFTLSVNYPDLFSERRPVQWILGATDPVCEARDLYRFVAGAPRAQHVSLVAGNHSFVASQRPEDPPSPTTLRTIDLAAELSAYFVAQTSATPAAASAAPRTTNEPR